MRGSPINPRPPQSHMGTAAITHTYCTVLYLYRTVLYRSIDTVPYSDTLVRYRNQPVPCPCPRTMSHPLTYPPQCMYLSTPPDSASHDFEVVSFACLSRELNRPY